MDSCEAVVGRAARMIGVVGEAEATPVWILEQGMAALEGLYARWITQGMFGRACDVAALLNGSASGNQRIRREGGGAIEITVQDLIETRPPRNRTWVHATDPIVGDVGTFLYDAYTGRWANLTGLRPTDPAPLSRMGSGLAACLAIEIADELGGQVSPVAVANARRFQSSLALSFDGPRQSVTTEYF